MSAFFFFSSRRRHTRCSRDWSSDVCSSDLLSTGHTARPRRVHTDSAHGPEQGDDTVHQRPRPNSPRRPCVWAHTRKPIARFNDSDVSRVAAAKPAGKRIGSWKPPALGASYSPGSPQVNRHEVLALRLQSLSSVTFEGCRHVVARTSQARLVVPPEPFDATCPKRAFRLLLQIPSRDQVLTAFLHLQNDRQHRRPSVHFHLLVSSTPCTPSFRRRATFKPGDSNRCQ